MPSDKQIGLMKDGRMIREPELCAVTGLDVRGKHAVTHYGPDGQFVYVRAQSDHLWPLAAPAYGFPVPEEEPVEDENVFVLEESESKGVVFPAGDNSGEESQFLLTPDASRLVKDQPSPRPRKPSIIIDPQEPSKGDD